MKKLIISTILLMVAAPVMLGAQQNGASYYADTLYISVDEHFRMMIVSENISRYEPADTLNKTIHEFMSDMMKFEWPDMEGRYLTVYYGKNEAGDAILRFKDISDDEKIFTVLKDGETMPPMPLEIVFSKMQGTQVHLMLSGIMYIDKLGEYNIESIVLEVLQKQKIAIHDIGRIAMTTAWDAKNGDVSDNFSSSYRNTMISDQLELSGTAGASLIRNQLVPSFDLMLGVSIANKTRIKHMVKADLSMNYIFNQKPEGGFTTDINTFIGGSYFINTSRNPEKPNWYGLGVAYLVWRNGDFFDETTWRVSLGAKFGERFSLMPELYVGNDFKNVMPGLKFRIWF